MSEFHKALTATLLVGAARADCQGDPERLKALRATQKPLVAAVQAGDYAEAERVVRAVMPEGWEPSSEWRLQP